MITPHVGLRHASQKISVTFYVFATDSGALSAFTSVPNIRSFSVVNFLRPLVLSYLGNPAIIIITTYVTVKSYGNRVEHIRVGNIIAFRHSSRQIVRFCVGTSIIKPQKKLLENQRFVLMCVLKKVKIKICERKIYPSQ